ncbi:hypothetical protein [Streptomyces fuscichromogenes]|uniref:Uncharacterized protein n=1 Tax=Streptomyces fuscichromogenes TaxID=1324013 RepID=A0A918CXP5_9ACTN|nr:hypothetical protein [Streptomyces fuscichromogenes]GGN46574.1 hypothetical protein GCM10011578_099590 [Streptomyces fuscichromogenes]
MEANADAVLRGITLYEAVALPLTTDGVSIGEQLLRRTIAYQLAGHEYLPRPVRVAAAEALEAIDQRQDRLQAQTAVRALARTVRECRTEKL